MNEGIYDWEDDLIIRKAGKKYYFKGMEDELLTPRELTIVLLSNKVPIEEVAFMRAAFIEWPQANEAVFNSFGEFLRLSYFHPKPVK